MVGITGDLPVFYRKFSNFRYSDIPIDSSRRARENCISSLKRKSGPEKSFLKSSMANEAIWEMRTLANEDKINYDVFSMPKTKYTILQSSCFSAGYFGSRPTFSRAIIPAMKLCQGFKFLPKVDCESEIFFEKKCEAKAKRTPNFFLRSEPTSLRNFSQ